MCGIFPSQQKILMFLVDSTAACRGVRLNNYGKQVGAVTRMNAESACTHLSHCWSDYSGQRLVHCGCIYSTNLLYYMLRFSVCGLMEEEAGEH